MLVSSAMDNAAKELSQYAYFYKMSGLQKFSEGVGEAAKMGKDDINSVIGSVDELYGSMTNVISDGENAYTNISEATKTGTLEWSDIEETYNSISNDAEDVEASINGVMEQFELIGDNPMAYMKSLVAIAGSEGLDLVKSRLIAAPLAKMFVRQQFGGKEYADENLRKLGIKDGLAGMNFNRSTIFTTTHPNDIWLVVYYEVELMNFFDMDVLSVKLCKQSRCGAWLGGDNVQELVDPTKETSASDGDDVFEGAEGADPGDVGAGNTDETTEATSGEETEPTETTETKPAVDTTNSIWHEKSEYEGYPEYPRDSGFTQIFKKSEDLHDHHVNYYYGVNEDGESTHVAYDVEHATSADDIDFYYGDIFKRMRVDINDDKDHKYLGEYGNQICLVVYVPENMPESEKQKILEKAEKQRQEFLDWYNYAYMNSSPENKEFLEKTYAIESVEIDIRPGGGNYDYSSEG